MKKKDTLLSIIIISYSTADLTIQTLESVVRDLNRSMFLHSAAEIIVIDNNSKDDSVKKLKSFSKNNSGLSFKLIENSKNNGFAAANNQGIAKAKGKYLLLLNSDTLVQAGALERMVMSFEVLEPDHAASVLNASTKKLDKLGILAATLLNWDGSYQPQGGSRPSLISLACHMFFFDDIPLLGRLLPSTQHTGNNSRNFSLNAYEENQPLRPKAWVGGTAMMIRRAVIDEIGDLDANLFMYGEDMEFCLRARKHHWDIAEHPTARVTHFRNASSSREKALIGEFKGYYYIWAKHKPHWEQPFLRFILQMGALLRMVFFDTIRKDKDKAAAYRLAFNEVPKK